MRRHDDEIHVILRGPIANNLPWLSRETDRFGWNPAGESRCQFHQSFAGGPFPGCFHIGRGTDFQSVAEEGLNGVEECNFRGKLFPKGDGGVYREFAAAGKIYRDKDVVEIHGLGLVECSVQVAARWRWLTTPLSMQCWIETI